MLLSINWLKRYVDLSDLSPEKIADDLTLSTAEIEGIEPFGAALAEVVVGHVVECDRHPNADRLSLTRVDDGGGELLAVVCGAPNVAQGQKIAFARIGTRLPDGTKIKKGKIRGEVSLGMICSERELGLSEDHTGILVLDDGLAPGTALTDVLPVRDTLLEIDNKSITHRPDLWGHYGFARELAATYDRPLTDWLEGIDDGIPADGETIPVTISASACTLYNGLVLRDVKIEKAPDWMRYLLLAIGQRPLNNVVDLTNFVLYDLGQPLHAFDLERLHGPAIDVRMARPGETITTLDGFERELGESDLLICDARGPVALAGVMGGEGSMVEPDTTSLLLESASFDATTIRRTSVRLGLRSESSARFEKSLDPGLALRGARKFSAMLQQMVPGSRAAGPVREPSGWSFEGRTIGLHLSKAGKVLGVELDEASVRGFLEPLGFAVTTTASAGDTSFDVAVPSWRATKDIEIEEDLIEEIGRRYRYGNIEPAAPLTPILAQRRDPELALVRTIRDVLASDCGYLEAYNYSFLPDDLCTVLGLEDLDYVRVTNAIATHMSRVRRDVLPGLLGSLETNLRHREVVPLFEVGKGYRPETPGDERVVGGEVRGRLPSEVHQVAAVFADRRSATTAPLARVRGHFDHLLRRLGRQDLRPEAMAEPPAWMHPGKTACWRHDDDLVAYAGEIHPGICEALSLDLGRDGGVAAFSLDVRGLLAVESRPVPYQPIPKFPEQPVDLAFLVPESVRVADMEGMLRAANPKLVRRVRLFEVYRGKGLPESKKSLNFTVVLGSDKRTLEAADEERYISRVREACAGLSAELRG